MIKRRLLSHMLGAAALMAGSAGSVLASTTITGPVEASA